MTWRTHLDDQTLQEIFDRRIRPSLDTGTAPSANPTVVFVGAQPGAGKTQSKQEVLGEHPDAVPVIGDDFRPYHPDYRELMRSSPIEMPGVTGQASNTWVEMSIDYLLSRGRSVLLETTMRQPGVVERTARAFRDAAYQVEIRALAVPGALSRMGSITRYLGTGGARSRWTPTDAHDTAYEAMPRTLERLVAEELADRVVVAMRSGRVLLDRNVTASTASHTAVDARRAVEYGRLPAQMSHPEGDDWVRQFLRAAQAAARSGSAEPELLSTMRTLHDAAPAIVKATFDAHESAQVLSHVDAAARKVEGSSAPRRRADPNTGPVAGPSGAGPSGPALR